MPTQSSPIAGDSEQRAVSRGFARTHIIRRLAATCAILTVVLAGVTALAVSLGAVPVSIRDLWAALLGQAPTDTARILALRLPRVALAALVGFALSLAGGAFQGMLMNPLADPYLIGVSSGAALGASLAIVFHASGAAAGFGVPAAAFVAALLTMIIVYRVAQARGRIGVESFILAGVVVGSFMWALVTVIMALSGRDLSEVVFWLMGNLFVEGWGPVVMVLGATAVGAIGIYAFARELNLLTLGEESAQQLGVDVERLKRWVIVFGSLLTAGAVSFCGIIGFVGLVIPHIARKIVGPDHRVLLPAAGLIGASFLILADTVARSGPWVLPVGVITSLLGAPFFLYLLRTRTRQ